MYGVIVYMIFLFSFKIKIMSICAILHGNLASINFVSWAEIRHFELVNHFGIF